jgi:hypothetical protein
MEKKESPKNKVVVVAKTEKQALEWCTYFEACDLKCTHTYLGATRMTNRF